MSRSYRKVKIFGNTIAKSEKYDKRLANRKLRRLVKDISKNLTIKEVSNKWDFRKDGKQYYKEATKKDMRK